MNFIHKLFLMLCLFPMCLFSQTGSTTLEEAPSFYPNEDRINREDITWHYLNVPENWDIPAGPKVKLAVGILKSTSENGDATPLVCIEGGPGASGLREVWGWLNHPIRKHSDIIMVDARGTGFSEPRLCPDLGQKFLEILSTDQDHTQDEKNKAEAALACKKDLLNRGIDIRAYTSKAIAQDLHALKEALNYKDWKVYAVSYGTQIAQVYANDFPEDIEALLLDSPISDLSQYYNRNTTNYANALQRFFDVCKKDPDCNGKYPNLEKFYYEVLEQLENEPLTVKVDKKFVPEGTFTYNVEDFKAVVQRTLYNKRLLEISPELIYQFHSRDEKVMGALSTLIASFSRVLLGLDYGTYYCITCNEAIPNNSITAYNADEAQHKKIKGGLSFYRSDFTVCDNWNQGDEDFSFTPYDLSNLSSLTIPVAVFAGGFDPITPIGNGKATAAKFQNATFVDASYYGHASSFYLGGHSTVDAFIKEPYKKLDETNFEFETKLHYVTDLHINGGIPNLANSLNELDLLFFAPFAIALVILLVTFLGYTFSLIKRRGGNKNGKLMKLLLVLTSVSGLVSVIGFVLGISDTASKNIYALAFGLPERYGYAFTMQWIFTGLLLLTLLYFILRIRKIVNTGVVVTILFSCILLGTYYYYWGFF
ncbi:MAG: alpha/beta fold hydrolase, partial [Bacteroidota bacterium]